LNLQFILWFDPRREHSSVPTARSHAVARRACQGWLRLSRPPEGLGLDWPEHGGILDRIETAGARHIVGKFKPVVLRQIHAAGDRPTQVTNRRNSNRVSSAHQKRKTHIAGENPCLRPNDPDAPQAVQRLGTRHDDIRKKTRLRAYIDHRVAQPQPAFAQHGNDDGLWECHNAGLAQIQSRVTLICLCPVSKAHPDVASKQRREVIAFGEDDEPITSTDAPDNVGNGVGVTLKRR
jgi:hypothetical protein